MCCAHAQGTTGGAVASCQQAVEIVHEDFDIELLGEGRFIQAQNVAYRPLTEQGVRALEQMEFSFTPGYEDLQIIAPHTLKKDGTRLDVPATNIMRGQGAVNGSGYQDTRHITIVFPKIEIGDQVEFQAIRSQNRPWFPKMFALSFSFSPAMVVREATISLTTSRDDMTVNVVAAGLTNDSDRTLGLKTRRTWHYHNEVALKLETDSVLETENGPRWQATTLKDYGQVANLYQQAFRDKLGITPELRILAESLTKGVKDRRQKANILYDWVSTHIRYVAIVLGAGGFVPHDAAEILKVGFGDCKDHVMLLEALLAAEDIKSSAVLIYAGAGQYRIPSTPTPFAFNHLITYVPEFSLFLDSTARYASFGVLPSDDSDRGVVIVNSGVTVNTPDVRDPSVRAETTVVLNPDGSADGTTEMSATGEWAAQYKAFVASIPLDREEEFFRTYLGLGSSGTLKRGDVDDLGAIYRFSTSYHIDNFTNVPGPGALPARLGFKPFSFSTMIGGSYPASRSSDYLCPSGTEEEDLTLALPQSIATSDIPPSKSLSTDGVSLQVEQQRVEGNKIRQHVKLSIQHPGPVCTPAYYAKVHDDLGGMLRALNAQLLYK